MKKLLVALFTVGLLAVASPASAIHKGAECRIFEGQDGAEWGEKLEVCLSVNDHDFEDQIQALAIFTNRGEESVTLHVSYIRLIKGTTTVRDTGSFIYTLGDHSARGFATTWLLHPSGTFHSRIRMWVCWPERAGDSCGSVVVWNSGNVTY